MAQSFIGKTISLISHSDIRYRGTLAGVDPVQSTIQLSNVYSMGTETRRPADQFIPPNPEPYHYIVFRASEVKDLAVDNEPVPTPPPRNLPNDPAILSSTAQNPNPFAAYNQTNGQAYTQPAVAATVPIVPPVATDTRQPASAPLETTGNNGADIRGSRHGGRRGGGGGGRGGHHGGQGTEITVPTSDFDFQGSNARFDKASIITPSNVQPVGDEGATKNAASDQQKAYNPKSSFFDTLSSSADMNDQGQGGRGGQRGRGGRGRGYGRSRREEERQKNVATFGEPGGIGLMGPGAYVGGYGGHGRRGRGARRGGSGPPPASR